MKVQNKLYKVGNIGNYYGGLMMLESEGKYFWGIENWNGTDWEEIPFCVYISLKPLSKEV
jgi:hypothetical protein